MIDATRDLSRAQALCRGLRAAATTWPSSSSCPRPAWPGCSATGAPPTSCSPWPARPGSGPGAAAHQRPVVAGPDAAIRVGDLVVADPSPARSASGRPLDLTYKEFELLRFLAARPGRVDPGQLLQEVWGYDFFGGTRTVDVTSAASGKARPRLSR